MGQIRIISRSRGGRCVYCHDGLDALAVSCPACHARWHADCCDPALARCPTLGCPEAPPGAPALDVRARPRGRRRRPLPSAGWVDAWTGPSTSARRWLRVRLAMGFVLAGLGVVGAAAGISTALLRPWAEVQPFLLGCLVLFVVGALSVLAMRRASRLFFDVTRLLDDARPALRFLSVVPPAEEGQRWAVRLEGPEGTPPLGVGLSDQLAPRWLRRRRFRQEPVLVYGLESPRGPYVIELRDGRLALLDAGLAPRRRRRRRAATRVVGPPVGEQPPPELLEGRMDMSEPL